MKNYSLLSHQLTILVNSCDSYEDLWPPFFTLLKKYLPLDVPIILNTESKNFHFDGLNIICAHPYKYDADYPYGKRLKNALKYISTEYTLLLLDDFFFRTPVDLNLLSQIIEWMNNDPQIVCFNSEATKVYSDWECDKYPGFRRIPPGNNFMLNMQAAIWRTADLQKYWRDNVSPWEWEVYCNVLTTKYPRDKFYCAKEWSTIYMNYGHTQTSDLWGVVKGKWILQDIRPLFEEEGIKVDFSIRGEYSHRKLTPYNRSLDTRREQFSLVFRCLGSISTFYYFLFRIRYKVALILGKSVQTDFFVYLLSKERQKYLKKKT